MRSGRRIIDARSGFPTAIESKTNLKFADSEDEKQLLENRASSSTGFSAFLPFSSFILTTRDLIKQKEQRL